MFSINKAESATAINAEIALIRLADKAYALEMRKAMTILYKMEWQLEPQNGVYLVDGTNITESIGQHLIEFLEFEGQEEEEEEYSIPEIEIEQDETPVISERLMHFNALVSNFNAETKVKIIQMTEGLHVKMEAFKEFTDAYFEYAKTRGTRQELATLILAKAMALTKEMSGSSLSTFQTPAKITQFRLINHLEQAKKDSMPDQNGKVTNKIDGKNYLFLIEQPETSYENKLLKSALDTYRKEAESGNLPLLDIHISMSIHKLLHHIDAVETSAFDGLF